MTKRIDTYPDLTDPRVTAPYFSTWRVGTPERQRRSVEAIAHAWLSRPWPTDRLLGYHVYTGRDGTTLLHYSQWTSEEAYRAYVRTHRQERNDEIDAAVPGIERVGITRYLPCRSLGRTDRDGSEPGCVVIVDIRFDGPGADRTGFVDTVAEALAHDPAPPPGGISAHFHLSADGTRVLNYAEWRSAQDHIDALAAPGVGVGSPSERWRRAQNWPGRIGSTIGRYEHALTLVPG